MIDRDPDLHRTFSSTVSPSSPVLNVWKGLARDSQAFAWSPGHLKGAWSGWQPHRKAQAHGWYRQSRFYDLPRSDPDIVLAPARMNLYVQRNMILANFSSVCGLEDFACLFDRRELSWMWGTSHALLVQLSDCLADSAWYKLWPTDNIGHRGQSAAKLCLDNVAKYRPPYLACGLTLGFQKQSGED